MLRDNKNLHSPDYWGYGLVNGFGKEAQLRDLDLALANRYRRGMALWSKLLDLPWWAWRRDREIVRGLGILRKEYREMLRDNLELKTPIIHVPYPSKIGPMLTPERRRMHPDDEAPYAPTFSNYPLDGEEEKRLRALSQRYTEPDYTAPAPAAPAAHTDHSSSYSGHGGSFGGAGASGSWDAPSVDSPSTDTSGGDCGGGGTCD